MGKWEEHRTKDYQDGYAAGLAAGREERHRPRMDLNTKTQWGGWAKAVLMQEAGLPTVADCCAAAALLEDSVVEKITALAALQKRIDDAPHWRVGFHKDDGRPFMLAEHGCDEKHGIFLGRATINGLGETKWCALVPIEDTQEGPK